MKKTDKKSISMPGLALLLLVVLFSVGQARAGDLTTGAPAVTADARACRPHRTIAGDADAAEALDFTLALAGRKLAPGGGKSKAINPIPKDENSDVLSEEFSFLIQDFKMNHQSQINNLNFKVRYRYENGISESKYPDFRVILKDIEDFLNNYPNKTDYWEILNKKITLKVLKKYPMLSSLTIEIQVSPSETVPYLRSSIVTARQSKAAGKKQ
jgi:hypothetical protein